MVSDPSCYTITFPVMFWALPVKQDRKKVNRILQKWNRAAKNPTGEQKRQQEDKKAYRRTQKCSRKGLSVFIPPLPSRNQYTPI
ncbi:hypothetical protein D1164_21550 [Mariniphaga sediminis]|uniref:Uncharacterized protein n=1 Tax=Mariniphaga sediminis TaxID=1628158 RepID=A0A399CSX8_9BACT|nr:hypothetical protein D1164_21550 [Mariniphaga sediminis]